MENNLFNYCLHLADNSLIMGHRLSEWTGHGPMLEQDIAISNIALDLIGQSRNFYQYAAAIKGDETTEDTLAYLRDAREFKNLLITEIPNGDWAQTILKLFFFSTYQFYLYQKLKVSSDAQLAAIAEKSLKEVTYHLRWSSEWVVRMGDGTEESHHRMEMALEDLWPYTGEMFDATSYENLLIKNRISVDVSEIENDWKTKIAAILCEATLSNARDENVWMQKGGKSGFHSEHLGYILAEMQFLQRAYPDCEW
ncbi:MAG: 1,2-phenylacetyl-CoA epoxidase subunit PaaC [Ginsengibacter sp.]